MDKKEKKEKKGKKGKKEKEIKVIINEEQFIQLMWTLLEDKVGMCFRRKLVTDLNEEIHILDMKKENIDDNDIKPINAYINTVGNFMDNLKDVYNVLMKDHISNIPKSSLKILALYFKKTNTYILLLHNGNRYRNYSKKINWHKDLKKKIQFEHCIRIDLNESIRDIDGFDLNTFYLKHLLYNISKHKYCPELMCIEKEDLPEYVKQNIEKIPKLNGWKDPLYKFYGVTVNSTKEMCQIFKIVHKNNLINNIALYYNYRYVVYER